MIKTLSGFALIFAAAASRTSSSAATQAQPNTSSTTFHSNALHFDYTYSNAFTPMTASETGAALDEAKGETTGVQKQVLGCISVPLTATDSHGGQRVIIILRKDGTCVGATTLPSELGATVASTLSKSLEKLGTPQMGASADYQIAGRNASAISGSAKSAQFGDTFYGTASRLIQGSDTICWEFVAGDCTKLPEMMKYPIAFEGKDAEPAIPAKFAQACK